MFHTERDGERVARKVHRHPERLLGLGHVQVAGGPLGRERVDIGCRDLEDVALPRKRVSWLAGFSDLKKDAPQRS